MRLMVSISGTDRTAAPPPLVSALVADLARAVAARAELRPEQVTVELLYKDGGWSCTARLEGVEDSEYAKGRGGDELSAARAAARHLRRMIDQAMTKQRAALVFLAGYNLHGPSKADVVRAEKLRADSKWYYQQGSSQRGHDLEEQANELDPGGALGGRAMRVAILVERAREHEEKGEHTYAEALRTEARTLDPHDTEWFHPADLTLAAKEAQESPERARKVASGFRSLAANHEKQGMFESAKGLRLHADALDPAGAQDAPRAECEADGCADEGCDR
jgi:hypothetical protein